MDEYTPSRLNKAPTSPGCVQASTFLSSVSLYSTVNRRRFALSVTSGSGAAPATGANFQEFRIAGVGENIRHADLKADGRETVYLSARAWTWADWELAVAVRTTTDPMSLVAPIRKELASLDPQISMAKIRAMEDYVSDAVAPNRFALILITIFAAVAVALASVGLYGVISYALAQRTREIGIRLAFGAPRASIFRLVLGQGLRLTILGVAIGVLGSFFLGGLISSLLFEVTAEDPLTYVSTAGLLILIALAACFTPARRATRVDPINAGDVPPDVECGVAAAPWPA